MYRHKENTRTHRHRYTMGYVQAHTCVYTYTQLHRDIYLNRHTHAQTHREMQVTCEDMNTHKDTDSHTYCDTLMSRYAR